MNITLKNLSFIRCNISIFKVKFKIFLLFITVISGGRGRWSTSRSGEDKMQEKMTWVFSKALWNKDFCLLPTLIYFTILQQQTQQNLHIPPDEKSQNLKNVKPLFQKLRKTGSTYQTFKTSSVSLNPSQFWNPLL